MAIEKYMPESPTTEEQNKQGLATAVVEREDTSEQDSKKAESEKPQVELEFKIFQAEKDKEIAKKAKALAKSRFDDLQNTSFNLNLSKLEQSIVKMLAPDVFAFINPEDGKVLGTLSTAKKEDPFAQYYVQPQTELIEREILDGKEFVVTYNPVTKEETSRVLADAEYVQKGEQEPIIELETAALKVLDGSRIQLLQSLASEMQEYAAYVEEVIEGGQKVFKVNTDKVLDDLNAGKLSREQVRHILEGNNEHFSGVSLADGNKTSEIEHDAEIKFTQHDLAEVIKTGYLGREKLEEYRTTPEGHFEVKLIDPDTGKTKWITSKSSEREQDNKDPNLEKRAEQRRIQQELARQFHSEEEQAKQRAFEQRVESQFLLDPETGEPVINPKTDKPIHLIGGGTLTDEQKADAEELGRITAKAQEEEKQRLVFEERQKERQAIRREAEDPQAYWDELRLRDPRIGPYNEHLMPKRELTDEQDETLNQADVMDRILTAKGLSFMPSREHLGDIGRRVQNERGELTTGFNPTKNALSFKEIYKAAFSLSGQPEVEVPAGVENIKDLDEVQRERFLAALPHLRKDGLRMDMNSLISTIIENPSSYYPGQDLAVILNTDKHMGLGGDLVRRRVEQILTGEEFDDTKKMRQENIGALFNAITQYLSSELDLQQELKVLIYTRLKLHETTILARYIGVDKLADAITDFYPDEMRVIKKTKLLTEAVMMLESEDGAYFRKGKGLRTAQEESEAEMSERYDTITIKMALLLMPSIPEANWDKTKNGQPNPNYIVDRKSAINAARKFVELANRSRRMHTPTIDEGEDNPRYTLPTWDQVIAADRSLSAQLDTPDKKARFIALFEERSSLAKLGLNFEEAYREVRLGFDKRSKMAKSAAGPVPIKTVIDDLNRKGDIKRATSEGNARSLDGRERQDLIDVFNEADRAFGLSIKVADIFGVSTRHDGLIDKQGRLIKPKTAILEFPTDLQWNHVLKAEDNYKLYIAEHVPDLKAMIVASHPHLRNITLDNKDAKLSEIDKKNINNAINLFIQETDGQQKVQDALNDVMREFRGEKIDLTKLSELEESDNDSNEIKQKKQRQKEMLKIIKKLKAKAISDTQTRAIRQMMIDEWDNINIDDSNRGNGIRRYRQVMWNQTQISGLNKFTKGKPFLRRYASAEVVSLIESTARSSILEQMEEWDDDFADMQHHAEELRIGAKLKKMLIEEPGLFNSTTKLNDPIEHLKKIKDELTDWTQEHRVDYMNFLFEGVGIYLTTFNKENPGFRNMDVVKFMNLMSDAILNSVIDRKEKAKLENIVYGGHTLAHLKYGAKKGDWISAILGLIGDIFKESTKGLTGK